MREPKRLIGAMYYTKKKGSVGWGGAKRPLAELIVAEDRIVIRPRLRFLRRFIETWDFSLNDVEHVRHRPLTGYRFSLKGLREVEFWTPSNDLPLRQALEKAGVPVER